MPYTWVHSAGGPLLIAPESELGHWGGAEDMDGPVETWGDYGRACSVRNYIGLVAIGSQQALVLGDQPARTTYLPGERVFLRGAAAGSDVVRRVLRDITWDPDEDLVWEVREPVVLFDSAWAGAEIEPDNQLLVDLDPGSYRVRATSLRDSGNWMILVRLQQIIGDTESAEAR
ncbi:Imm21 family immunity protein [Nocardia sp. NBC_00416]|uniref:Imm21 family immunity protein n=1 Tax=Nocardia sp. NBC_00416 TaxID=2975991 RepID=UPI002E1D943E